MRSLDEAWEWYRNTRESLTLFSRLGRKYWDEMPWEGAMGNDSRFQSLEGPVAVEMANRAITPLDDLAVFVLFSVFESKVREKVLAGIQLERANIRDKHLLQVVDEALDRIENGSIFNVLRVFKLQDHDLVEEVNQVRKYRNWVAHGRRSQKPGSVEPAVAYERLKKLLAVLDEFPLT